MNERNIWSYWLVTNLCIAIGLLFWPPAMFLAMATTAAHSGHFLMRSPGLTSFPMQVRIGFLALLAIGQVPGFGWVHWVQLLGTSALLTTGYCPLARLLVLLPWNRSRPLSRQLFAKAIFTPPVAGGIVRVVSPD